MKIREICFLSRREITAYPTRNRATVIVIGILFGLLLAALVILQGLENVTLKFAGSATDGKVYLVSIYSDKNNQDLIYQRLAKYGGIVVAPTNKEIAQLPESAIVAEFNDVVKAYNYFEKTDSLELYYDVTKYETYELHSKQLATYRWFMNLKAKFVRPASLVLLVVAVFILAFTMSHILSQNTRTFVLYRSLGASRAQLILIYFAYMLQLVLRAIAFAVTIAVILAGISTVIGWHYFSTELAILYPLASHYRPILFGINWQCLETLLWMLIAVPPAFLLCLDQFSNQKLALKLKGD